MIALLALSHLALAGHIDGSENVEVLALNVDRGVAAIRVRMKGTHNCSYRGMGAHPTSGTSLMIWELSGEKPIYREDIYPAATKASQCIPHAASVIRLKHAKDTFKTWQFKLDDKPAPVDEVGSAFKEGWTQGPYTIYTMKSAEYVLSPAYVEVAGQTIGTDPNPVRPPDPPPHMGIAHFNRLIATAEPGETITIPAGRYDVDIDEGMKVVGRKGLRVVADGEVFLFSRKPDRRIISIDNSSDIVIDGFRIAHEVDVECSAACVAIESSANITIRRNDIHGSGAYGVAAWGHDNADIKVIDNLVHNCSYWGMEIHSKGGEVTGNALYDNSSNLDVDGGIKQEGNVLGPTSQPGQ